MATTVGVQWVFNLLVVVRNIGTYQVQINFFVCKSCKLQSESLDQHSFYVETGKEFDFSMGVMKIVSTDFSHKTFFLKHLGSLGSHIRFWTPTLTGLNTDEAVRVVSERAILQHRAVPANSRALCEIMDWTLVA